MLKTVVENETLRLEFLDRNPGRIDPIRILKMGHVGQTLLEFESFVIDATLIRSVAPTENRNANLTVA